MSPHPSRRAPWTLLIAGGLAVVLLAVRKGPPRQPSDGRPLPSPCVGVAGDSDDDCRPIAGPGLPGPAAQAAEAEKEGRQTESIGSDEACADAGYLCADLAGEGTLRVWHWPDRTTRITVWVPEPDGLPMDRARELQRAAVRGIRAWDRHPFPLSISTGRRADDCDVPVRWVPTMEEGRLGRAQMEWTLKGTEVTVKVLALTLATHEPGAGGSELDPGQVELVAAHEMGHVLGLSHSDDPRDIMYPENTATHLTVRDFLTLEALYGLPNGVEVRRR